MKTGESAFIVAKHVFRKQAPVSCAGTPLLTKILTSTDS